MMSKCKNISEFSGEGIYPAPLFQRKSGAGFTLIEVVISAGIIAILALMVGQIYVLIVSQIAMYREQTVMVSLADQYLEVARNLPYSQVGTLGGNPHGNLADQPNPIAASINGVDYQIYYVVNFIDDPADGTIVVGTDSSPNDYKQVKLYIKNTRTNFLNSFVTNIVPKGLEGLNAGGALFIKVFDAVGQPVAGAAIHIQNTVVSPNINLTRSSDAAGNWVEVALPNSANSYHITVTKNGYSSDQTYAPSLQNPNPIKTDSTISNGQVTQVSFSIDRVSDLVFSTLDEICSPLPSVNLQVTGSKLIGTPAVLKFDNNYISDSLGQVALHTAEWDSYNPVLVGGTLMIYGTSPTEQATILPNTTETFNLILGPKTANSLLVIVKDAATSNPIEGANVDLQTTGPSSDTNKITGGSMWSQQDWSLGSGQLNFTNPKKYSTDDGNVSTTEIPLGLRLAQSNGVYASQGVLTSSSFDTGTDTTSYTTLSWQPTSQDPLATIKFQIATNNDNTTWNYLGPDGTANSYYTVSGTTINPSNNNAQYISYKAFLSTQDTSITPVLTSININYVSGCFTPGQVMFVNLGGGSNYNVIVSAAGYQSQTVSSVTINGYNVLQVLLSH